MRRWNYWSNNCMPHPPHNARHTGALKLDTAAKKNHDGLTVAALLLGLVALSVAFWLHPMLTVAGGCALAVIFKLAAASHPRH